MTPTDERADLRGEVPQESAEGRGTSRTADEPASSRATIAAASAGEAALDKRTTASDAAAAPDPAAVAGESSNPDRTPAGSGTVAAETPGVDQTIRPKTSARDDAIATHGPAEDETTGSGRTAPDTALAAIGSTDPDRTPDEAPELAQTTADEPPEPRQTTRPTPTAAGNPDPGRSPAAEETTAPGATAAGDETAWPTETPEPDETSAGDQTVANEKVRLDEASSAAWSVDDSAIGIGGRLPDDETKGSTVPSSKEAADLDEPPFLDQAVGAGRTPGAGVTPSGPAESGGDREPQDDQAAEPSSGDSGRGAGSGGVRPAAWTAPDETDLADQDLLRAVVEAVLLVVDTPTSATVLAQGLGRPVADVERALQALRADYDSQGRGLDLREVAGGWRLYTREALAPYVERFVLEGQQAKLTQAALETLAVVAYRQPVTRSRVSAIRGVNVDGVMRTLLSRGLVEECGADPETGGGLYRTTSFFLEKMGLTSLDELPSLAPLLPDTSQLDDVGLST